MPDSESQDQPQQQRKVAHMTITVDGFNRLVDQLTELPYKHSAPIINDLQRSARAIFQDQLARIVDVPVDPPDGANESTSGTGVAESEQGGA